MIVSGRTSRVSPRWLHVSVLLCAMVVLPLAPAIAHDFDAVERRLGQAVAEGEITLKQAAVMMDALRRTTAEAKHKGDGAIDARLDAIGAQLKAAVKAGKITEEEARAKWEAIKGKAAGKDKDGGRHDKDDHARVDAHLREVWAKLQAAVKAGKMSEEDAHRKMAAIKREVLSKFKDSANPPK